MHINNKRIRKLKEGTVGPGPVVLWMSRDQRINDNWALLYAQALALKQKSPLAVVFCLVPELHGASVVCMTGLGMSDPFLAKYVI